MRVRPWPSRPFKPRRAGVVVLSLLAAALLSPSRQEGAQFHSAEHSLQPAPTLANHRPSHAEQARAIRAYGNLPLGFEANQGQTDSRVRFLSRSGGYSLFLTPNEAVLTLQAGQTRKPEGKTNGTKPAIQSWKFAAPAVLRMQLMGSNAAAGLMGMDELPGKSNYFLGNDPSQWHTDIPNYGRVTAAEVYPGIDLVYHGNHGQLEYDFEVAPHAEPRKIRFVLKGIQSLRTDSRGDLLVKVASGELRFRQPVAYQKEGGVERPVPVRYVLKGKNQVAFRLARYDTRQPLLIDPVLAYSTYLGGSSIDSGNGIAVAPDGTAFIAGGTFSTDFPTEHPLQSYAGDEDAFVAKISADGSTLLYSTYLGGKNYAVANAIAVDAAGEAFVTGTTDSPDFPVANGFDSLCGGDGQCGATWNPQGYIVSNAFVTKLNVAGSALVYSSFLGVYENVQGLGIAVDSGLNAYVTGAVGPNIAETVVLVPPATPPPLFPTGGGFQTCFGGSDCSTGFGGTGTDAFISKIDASGSQILYSSYLGGSNEDVGYGIAVDSSANAYLTGLTYSTDFPLTNTATYTSPLAPLQGTYSGAGDAFLSKVNTNATGTGSLLYSTYLGGSGLDQGNGVAVDSSGNAYVTGGTTSIAPLGFTIPGTAYQSNCALDAENVCEGDAFVAKLNPTLSGSASLLYFTYLGGSLADSGTGIALDPSNNVYITGSTVSSNAALVPFPIAGTVFQPVYGGGNADAFVAELNLSNPPSTALVYSTYLGGSNTETGSGIAVDTNGGAYVTGQTCSLDFPLVNPLQAAPGGNCDAFVSKVVPSGGVSLSPAGLVFPIQSLNSTSAPQTVTLTNGGSTALTITNIALTGADTADFSQINTCDGSVATLGQCTITVTFTPKVTGTLTAQITIADNSPAPNSTQVVDLTGTGGNLPTVTLSTNTLAFGNQAVNTTSSPLFLTVTNTGTAALNMTSAIASGDFAVQTNGCTVPLQATTPPSNCVIGVTFTPTSTGSSIDSLTLTDNAPDSPQVILLTGTGVLQSAVSLSASTLSFGSQVVNSTSAAQIVTVTNTGTGTLTLGSITATAPFAQTNTCGSSLTAGGICTISVTFTPTTAGSAVGSVTLVDNAANSPQTISLTGTGVSAPIATLSPPSVSFPTQAVGTTSTSQTVTLANTGTATLFIVGITASANFGATNNCGASVGVGGSCSIYVTFTPTAVGNLYGTLTVTDNNNGAASTQVVPLAGSGFNAPAVSLSASTLSFGSQVVNSTSAAQIVTVTNTGTATLTLASITATAPFAQTNTCGSSLTAGGICTISVTFTPTTAGSAVGSVTLVDNAGNSPQTISLTGTGVSAPIATLSPASVTFATPQAVGITSAPLTVTLANTGTATLIVVGITASANFGETNNCGASVGVGGSCSIYVTFTPTAVGNLYGTLTVTDNNNGTPASTQVVPLAGVGQGAPAVSLSASTLSFGPQIVNSTSTAQTVTVTNTGTAPLTFTGIVASAGFAETNTCGSPVAPNAICTISVTFTPSAAGSAVGSVSLRDNAPGSPQAIILSGTGILGPIVSLSETNLTFGPQNVGTTSPAQAVTLTNTGSAPLEITAIAATGDFAQTNTCPSTLVVGAVCIIHVTFTPTAVGNRYGTVTIADNAANSPQTIILGGTGLSAPAVSLSASTLSFGSQVVNTTSAAQVVTVTNTGTATLTLASITATAPFAQTNTCGSPVAAGGICTISVTFTPTAAGSAVGSVTLVDNAGSSPQTISLTGTGVTAPIASLSPASVTFTTPQAVGTTSAPLTVTLTNPGSATLIIVGITASANFGETNNCGASVGVGGSCSIYVTFTPTAVGNLYGTLTVTDNNNGAPASTQVVPLAGSGLSAPAVAFSPASLAFANQIVNTASAPLNVTLSNTGSAVLNIASITTSGDFAQTNTCGTSLANGTSCTISVTFTPTAAGPRAGAIIVTDNAPGSPHQVPLTGSGLLAPIVTLAPGSLTFTGQPVGSTSAPQTVILTNTGSAALNITTMAASGNFAQTNTCGASVAPGISCTITVTFTPTAPGSRYGSVTLTDNAVNSPQTIGLAGDGLPAPVASLSTLSLTFPSQALGTTSAPQTVTLSDTGTAALIITSIVATGDFAQIDTCGTSLAVGASCTISVTFAPTAAGSRTGAITINDNAPGSPQVVNLGGSGAGFGVSVTPISATVIAGDSVAYTLSVAPSFGFNASVILGCAGAPRNATCSVSPASVTPNGTNPATATVTVTTGQRSLAPPGSGPNLNLPRLVTRVRPTWFLWLLLFLTVLTCQAMARRRRALLRLALVMGLLLLWAACGGGGSQVDVPNGTPAGNYTLTLSGTSGNVTRNVSASLTVK